MKTTLAWITVALVIFGVMWVTMLRRAASPVAVTGVAKAGSTPGRRDSAKGSLVVAAGVVEPSGEEYRIGSSLDGRLSRVLVDEGSMVSAGQVVAELDSADYAARVDLAKAEVAARQAQLDRLRAGSREEERSESDALLRQAEARVKAARQELERRRPLLETGAISRSEFDQAVREESTASAAVDQARSAKVLVAEQTRSEDLRRAEADLAAAQARLAEALALMDKTTIRSPISGQVLRRWKKTGESVSALAGTDIVSIGNLSRLVVRAEVDETDVAKVRLSQPAYVTAEAYPGIHFTGHIVRIAHQLGRKKVFTDEPTERVDKKTMEALVQLDAGQKLPVGLRVDVFIE
jgi:HlyD family secretion protein